MLVTVPIGLNDATDKQKKLFNINSEGVVELGCPHASTRT